jgi:hypothetical protein
VIAMGGRNRCGLAGDFRRGLRRIVTIGGCGARARELGGRIVRTFGPGLPKLLELAERSQGNVSFERIL